MPEERTFRIRWIKEGGTAASELDAPTDIAIDYKGAEVMVSQ